MLNADPQSGRGGLKVALVKLDRKRAVLFCLGCRAWGLGFEGSEFRDSRGVRGYRGNRDYESYRVYRIHRGYRLQVAVVKLDRKRAVLRVDG